MRTNPLPHFKLPEPALDRAPAPVDELAAFMARRNFYCQALRCSMAPHQCQHNQQSGRVLVCSTCTQERTVVAIDRPARRKKGHNPNSPWRASQERMPKAQREALAVKPNEVNHGTPGLPEPVRQAGKAVPQRPAPPARQAGRQAGSLLSKLKPAAPEPPPVYPPEVMEIHRMVLGLLQKKKAKKGRR